MKTDTSIFLSELARDLRNYSSVSESLMWQKLRSGKMYGYHFIRHKTVGTYLVDFYCHDLQLIIEIDNKRHQRRECHLYDIRRRLELEEMGYQVLHFDDHRIKTDLEAVLIEIELYIIEFQQNEQVLKESIGEYGLPVLK